MKPAIGRLPNTKQDSAEYGKKLDAKATIAESKALAEAAAVPAIIVARFAVLVAFIAVAIAVLALIVTMRR